VVIRILVTGSREWTDREAIWEELGALAGPIVIVHGDNPRGADRIAKEFAIAHAQFQVTHEAYPADWNTHGKAGGPIRNQRMVDLGADLCLAFPTARSVGTWDCIKRANRAGIPVRIVPARG
jgi:hypothetical protein